MIELTTESITIRPTDIVGVCMKDLPGGWIEITDNATFKHLVQGKDAVPRVIGTIRIDMIAEWLRGYGSLPYLPCLPNMEFPSETEELRRVLAGGGTIS